MVLNGNDGPNEFQIDWNGKEEILLNKLINASRNNEYCVKLTDDDIKDFKADEGTMPVTMTVTFKILDGNSGKIQFLYTIGPSAAVFIGRFAKGDENTLNIIKEVVGFENEVLGDKIIAEIAHLPKSRIGNVLSRPAFREYEIPYLAKSLAPTEFQISPDDLMVSVKGGNIVLRSKRLNKEIEPRLNQSHCTILPTHCMFAKFFGRFTNTKHNYPLKLVLIGGVIARSFKFLPRAEYENVIIHPATWNLRKQDYEILLQSTTHIGLIEKVNSWRGTWKMPRYIALKENDNESSH